MYTDKAIHILQRTHTDKRAHRQIQRSQTTAHKETNT